eukprot:TRINITY_DN6233_c0_g1_i1.p1 TRINITY_DN6233_c0_g1~~TRINITY_DN6233_c0_g1_i1.p1  ORF type:complete len:123 (-),score=42.07 TRINITY_DN6233_c0_g1_i1:127-495(-)
MKAVLLFVCLVLACATAKQFSFKDQVDASALSSVHLQEGELVELQAGCAVCPNGWFYFGNGICQAPLNYAGPCGKLWDLHGYSAVSRATFARLCHVTWGCDSQVIFPIYKEEPKKEEESKDE